MTLKLISHIWWVAGKFINFHTVWYLLHVIVDIWKLSAIQIFVKSTFGNWKYQKLKMISRKIWKEKISTIWSIAKQCGNSRNFMWNQFFITLESQKLQFWFWWISALKNCQRSPNQNSVFKNGFSVRSELQKNPFIFTLCFAIYTNLM